MALAQQRIYTLDDIYALPEGERAELIDGRIYMMSPPSTVHQRLVSQFTQAIGQHISTHGGSCEVFPAPFAVFLNADDKTYVEPDISVICSPDKLTDKGCSGAPDWVIEIVSPASAKMDYGAKLFKYRTAGVREYWVVNPLKSSITVFDFEKEEKSNQYTFDEDVNVCIYDNLSINITELLK